MKKRIFVLICALALLVGCIVVTSMAATQTGYCEACKQTVTWEPIKFGAHALPEGETTLHKHYYFDKDYNHTSSQQINLRGNNMTLCIDLNGKSWYSWGRALYANYSESGVGDKSTINIQDSVGGGKITSRSEATGLKADGSVTGTNNTGGATIWVEEKCTVNIYGGTFLMDPLDSQWGLRTDSGGIASVKKGATLNVYGGTIQGGAVKNSGGAVYLYAGSYLNVYGGAIKSGTSLAGKGGCVTASDSAATTITLSGNAQVDNIYLNSLQTINLKVSGAFTGKASLTYAPAVTNLAIGTQVGTLASGASVDKAQFYCTNGFDVAADGTALKLVEPNEEELMYECEHCKQVVKWEVFSVTPPSEAGSYHFYLNKDYDTSTAKQYSLKENVQVCLDLHGHKYNTTGRSLATSGANSVFSVMDTVGGGTAGAIGGNNNPGGGSVNVASKTTFNLYSGTLTYTHKPSASTSFGGAGRGAVVQNSGTMNVYGGKIEGGEVVTCTYAFSGINGAGGAIYNGGTLNVLSGEITMGKAPETGAGPCVYVPSGGKVALAGDAKVADIYFAVNNAANFNVDASFVGTAQLSYAPGVTLSQNLVVGTCAATDWQGVISCNSESFPAAMPKDGQLVLSAYPAGTIAATDGQGYTSLQEAVDAAAEGAVVELLGSVKGDVSVTKNVTLQLGGCSIDGTVTVAEGKTLFVLDAATDDYTVADGKYGKIKAVSGNVAGAQQGSNTYVMISESSGVSFHCVTLQIYAMTLRTDAEDQPGIFYKSHFKADEKAAPMVETYGVALSVIDVPTAETMGDYGSYTVFENFEAGPNGNLGNASSTLLTGVLKNRYSEEKNRTNLELDIYGRAYAKTTDGQILMGQPVQRSLREQLEGIDAMMDGLSAVQTQTVTDLYAQFKDILSGLQLANIASALDANEEGTLKVLVLGNSHGLDATNLLAEVFYQERVAGNHDRDVLIAALYYGGCRVDQHKNFLENNQMEYTYHKNYATTAGEKWVVKDATCLDALRDEQWDVILMQQMNTQAGREGDYKASNWKFVADYLLNNQDEKPILGFHMTWANPDDYELFLNDDAPYNIRYISTYSDPTSWRNNHEKSFSNANGKYDKDVMYAEIMRLTQKYLVDSTDWLGADYFDEAYIMNSATPIQYLQNVLGREQLDVYRDYTHISDYGRLTVAYQWYAQLLGLEELTEVNTDVIPKNLKHKNSKYPTATDANGDYIVDEKMKSDLIEAVNWALKNPWNLPTE